MAAAEQPRQDSSVALVMVHGPKELATLLYELDLQHIFSGQPSDDDEFPPVLSFPKPVVRFRLLCRGEVMAIASSGNLVVTATTQGRTLICNRGNTDASAGPDQLFTKLFQALAPAGDDMFLSMPLCPQAEIDSDPDRTGEQDPCFELLLRLPNGPWAWHLIPDPPGLSGKPDITGFFADAAGAHVWVSFKDQGTFSFDAARRRWRMEGAWELPLAGRSILVSDGILGGRKLLFGKLRGCEDEYDRLAACDMDARPPAIIKCWSLDEICPSTRPRAWPRGYLKLYNRTELAYLGGGRLCITMLIENNHHRCSGWSEERPNPHLLTITAVDVKVTPELQLIKHKFSCYSMPQDSRAAWAL
uniref:DUF1618 domain-containing protein n=2 Tax=Aegilops tauschii TaxID=37682 RepID=A0A453Q4L9_AEGTS